MGLNDTATRYITSVSGGLRGATAGVMRIAKLSYNTCFYSYCDS